SASARRAFEDAVGKKAESWPEDCLKGGKLRSEFQQWRRNNITNLVRAARETVDAVRTGTALSAAVYGYWPGAMESVAQDAELWAKEKLVDFLCPMNYSGESWEAGTWLRRQLKSVDGAVPVYTGLANYMCASPEDLKEQIREAREFGADGFITFQCTEPFAKEWLPALAKDVVKQKSTGAFQHAVSRPEAAWLPVPEKAERLLPRIVAGDHLQLNVKWNPESAPAPDSLKAAVLRNGVPSPGCGSLSLRMLNDREASAELVPERPGYYRIQLEWKDASGAVQLWRSSTKLVYGF
ncbi:MAG: family 10 glycosylhydrolase, partial [Victivallales bacterium]|nr:family 10 glycosylhydrolase [Victivallales bacterium]